MTVTNILSEISRSDVYPLKEDVSLSGNSFYLSMKIDDWTEQMYKELPSIRFSIYVNYGSLYFLYKTVNVCLNTEEYNGNYSLKITDIPDNCVLYVEPLFDNNAIPAHNNLVETGIIDDNYWNTTTNTFPVTIDIICSESKPEPSPIPDDCPFTCDVNYFIDSAVSITINNTVFTKLNSDYAVGMVIAVDVPNTGVCTGVIFMSPISQAAVAYSPYHENWNPPQGDKTVTLDGVTWYVGSAGGAVLGDFRNSLSGMAIYPDIVSWSVNSPYGISDQDILQILYNTNTKNK